MSTENGEPPLQIRDLHKSYGQVEVLQGLDLTIDAGAIHGLVGLNGSGKTTTLDCVLGLQSYNRGNIALLGYSPAQLNQAAGRIVAIFDSPSLQPGLTVRQCLDHATLLCKEPVRTPQEVEALLGISRYSKYRIRHLSLGNKRRASIANALIGNPGFILLDEPFNGLDAEGVEDVLALITQLNRDEGTTFLLSSHQLPYLERICTHMAILHQGKIAMCDKTTDLLGSQLNRVNVQCDEPSKAQQIIGEQRLGHAAIQNDGSLMVELADIGPGQLNQILVAAGLMISELRPQRQSLETLFYDITSSNKSGEAHG